MAKLFNRAKMTTSTTGTGTVTLGSASVGFQSFADAGVSNSDVVQYVIEEGCNFEIGTGTYTASGTTLSRSPTESSNSGSAISLTGAATVSVTAIDDDFNRLEHNGSTKVAATATGATVTGTLAATAVTGDGSALTGIQGIPSGAIMMWHGTNANIPTGFVLCDGNNGTPDLTDRFVLGRSASSNSGANGGSSTITLAEGNLPTHTHSVDITTGGATAGTPSGNISNSGNHSHDGSSMSAGAGGDHSHNFNHNTGNAGGHNHNTNNSGNHTHSEGGIRSGTGFGAVFPVTANSTWNYILTNSGTTGGGGAHSHNISNAGSHSHNFNANTGNSGNHTHNISGNTGAGGDHNHNFTGDALGNHTHTVQGNTGGTGSGSAVMINPVHFTIAFIMKT